jgi:hypothetical protein
MYDDDNGGTDARISALFRDTTAEVEPDVPALVRGGIVRGRVKRRRHNLGTATAAIATAAVVVGGAGIAAGVAPGLGTDGTDGTGLGPAASGSTGSVASPTGTATQPPAIRQTTRSTTKPNSPPPIPVADIPVEAADLPGLFNRLHPGKVTPADQRTGRIIDDGRAGQIAHFRWNGFATTVAFVAYAGTPEQRCRELLQDATQSGESSRSCLKRPDGTVLTSATDRGPHEGSGGGTSVVSSAMLFTKNGYEIFALSYNSGSKTGPILAENPPFDAADLARAVTSDIWY